MKTIVTPAKAGSKKAKHGNAPDDHDSDLLLAVKIDGKVQYFPPDKLLDTEFADSLAKACEQAEHAAAFRFTNLLDFKDPDRWAVLDFLASLSHCLPVVGGKEQPDLFTAVLEVMENDPDLERCRKAKLAALEIAVLRFPDALNIACPRIQTRMKDLGYRGVRSDKLIQEAQKLAAEVGKSAKAISLGPQEIRVLFPDAPVAPKVRVPSGWQLTTSGLTRGEVGEKSPGVSAPVVIVERCRDVHKSTEWYKLAWRCDGQWQWRIVERKVAANSRTIVDLAGEGLPVTSNNARLLVQYLADFEAANRERLPVTKVTHKMGWQGDDGKDGFLWGRTLVTAKGMFSDAVGGTPHASGKTPRIRFRGADQGDDQLADGFRQAGTFEDWVETVKRVVKYPRALLALYGSFVPPLLPLLKTPNFVIDFSGSTSTGKTTCLRLAASVWGNPAEGSEAAALSTWSGTATWRERAPAVLNHIPFILDETKHVKYPDEVAKTIYAVVGGRGRGRGTVQGIAPQDCCQTVLFSSGEQPATSFTQDGGTRPRVLTLWGSPFGGTSQKIGKRVRRLNTGLTSNYGHAGPRFVQFLLKNRDTWEEWRKLHETYVNLYQEKAGNNAVAGRMGAHFAAITAASRLVHIEFDLPWEWADPIDPLWDELTQESGEADQAAAALRVVMSWAFAHRENFYRLLKADKEQPHDGWAGRWDLHVAADDSLKDSAPWEWVGFMPHLLEKLLRDAGHAPNPIVRMWKDRGWLKIDSEASGTIRNQHRVKVGRELVRLYAIRREAVEAVLGG